MTTVDAPIRGLVARLITDEVLAINRGSEHGVQVGDVFAVLDTSAEHITDPETQEDLGSFRRVKVRVRVTAVNEKVSLAERVVSSLHSTSRQLAAMFSPDARPTAMRGPIAAWPEGVEVRDPVEQEKPPPRQIDLAKAAQRHAETKRQSLLRLTSPRPRRRQELSRTNRNEGVSRCVLSPALAPTRLAAHQANESPICAALPGRPGRR